MVGPSGRAGLENIALLHPLRTLTKGQRRQAGGAAEAAHEVRQVGKTAVERNHRDGQRLFGQQPRRMAQPAADQVLVRRCADDACEQPQEVEAAAAGLGGSTIQVHRPGAMRLDPCGRTQRPPALARARFSGRRRCAGVQCHESGRQLHADLVQRKLVAAFGGGLGQGAQHTQRGQRRHGDAAPRVRMATDLLHQFVREGEAQAFVAAAVVFVGTGVFVARMANEEGAADQLQVPAAAAAAEAAAPHIGQRVVAVLLGTWPLLRPGSAAPQRGRDLRMAGRQRLCDGSGRFTNLHDG